MHDGLDRRHHRTGQSQRGLAENRRAARREPGHGASRQLGMGHRQRPPGLVRRAVPHLRPCARRNRCQLRTVRQRPPPRGPRAGAGRGPAGAARGRALYNRIPHPATERRRPHHHGARGSIARRARQAVADVRHEPGRDRLAQGGGSDPHGTPPAASGDRRRHPGRHRRHRRNGARHALQSRRRADAGLPRRGHGRQADPARMARRARGGAARRAARPAMRLPPRRYGGFYPAAPARRRAATRMDVRAPGRRPSHRPSGRHPHARRGRAP